MSSFQKIIYSVHRKRRYTDDCPYRNSYSDRCMASLFAMLIDRERMENCCSAEDYDGCPMFLSRVLRDRQL